VDEMVVTIAETGEISLNDEPMDTPVSREMPKLKATLIRLKKANDEAKSPTLVTIVSDPGAKYSRTVDALDALALAGITNVTFTVSEEE
jgi:biopolymer transport protein ExbD